MYRRKLKLKIVLVSQYKFRGSCIMQFLWFDLLRTFVFICYDFSWCLLLISLVSYEWMLMVRA